MAILASPPDSFEHKDIPLTPELALAAAIVRQAVKDLSDPRPHVQAEARAFWANPAAVAFWSELTGIDLARCAPPLPQQPHEQLSLFAWMKAGAAVIILSTALMTGCAPVPQPSPPQIAITSPVSMGTYGTSSPSISVGGTAQAGSGATISSLTWSCPGCAAPTSGTLPNSSPWSLAALALHSPAPSTQTFTITVTNSAGQSASVALAITFSTTVAGGGICDPSNYPGFLAVGNAGPMPYNFCAYAWDPYRNRLPDNPTNIDTANTTKLQNQYIPGSALATCSWCNLIETAGTRITDPHTQGGSGYPVYVASNSDPTISVSSCANLHYGCSDSNGNTVSSIPGTWHIPAWARPSQYVGSDHNIEIIQPDGRSLSFYQCWPIPRDWQTGDTIGDGGSMCKPSGITYATSIVTDKGVNTGVINGGDNFAALPVHYQELVVHGQINHPMVFWMSCASGYIYPAGAEPAACSSTGSGIPAGSRLWLSMTRADIDAFAAANPHALPQFLKPVAYALHEYGAYVLDTGAAGYAISQIGLEDLLPELFLPGGPSQTDWVPWMNAHGGGVSPDHQAKLYGVDQVIDWGSFPANKFFVLSTCYAYGTTDPQHRGCNDSLPPPTGGAPPPTIAITSPATTGSFAIANATLTTLAGTASVTAPATISQLAWTCTGCVQPSGTITPGTNWSVASIGLNAGVQTITVTVTDSNNLTAAAAIAVTRTTTTTNNPPKGTFLYWRSLAARE